MTENPLCPECRSGITYPIGSGMSCAECGHEWHPDDPGVEDATDFLVLDANGNPLKNGDSVIVIKNLPVKGSPRPIKAGTKVKNIRLTEGDHNIDCKIDGFGAMGLKSEFVKKA